MLVSIFFLAMLGDPFSVSNPVHVTPQATRIGGNTVYFENDRYKIRLMSLSFQEFRDYLLKMGVKAEVIDKDHVRRQLEKMAVFRFDMLNRGDDNMVFNPDQAMIRAKRGPDGYIVDMATFWPQNLPDMDLDLARFARIFARGAVELATGEKHSQLLAFNPVKKRFSKKFVLELERLYYGIETFDIHCQYEIRYPKK